MQVTEILYFAMALFVALAVLIKWKYRRDVNAERMNRGLRGYVAESTVGHAAPEETPRENLIPA
ncbi:MAG: hypothetical protein NTW28_04975 [Candidatus Solibacter sp.]|nr:hypothetical protein [Candidatus Solibacter sp.]